MNVLDQVDELLALAWRDPPAAERKKAELVERVEQAERALHETMAELLTECGARNRPPDVDRAVAEALAAHQREGEEA